MSATSLRSFVIRCLLISTLILEMLYFQPVSLANAANAVPDSDTWQNVGQLGFSAGGVYYPSLALDSSGVPYVAYADASTDHKATVMKFDAGSGNWVTVGAAGFSTGGAYFTSLALDSDDVPYVAYGDVSNGFKATVMKFDAGSGNWVMVGAADFSGDRIDYPSLALDSNGVPYVAYQDYGNGSRVTVMKFDTSSGNWVTVGAAGFSVSSVYYPSLGLNSNGVPYVVYSDEKDGKATVMKFDASSGNWVTVGSAGFSAGGIDYPCLALDSSGVPYVAYEDYGDGPGVTVMKFDVSSGNWATVGSAGFSAGWADFLSFALDNSDVPYVAYSDGGNAWKATVMKFDTSSGNWVTVGAAGFSADMADTPSIALDSNGVPYVAYKDYANDTKVSVMRFGSGAPTVHYVKQNASGANNGTSWANAYTDLQSALAASSSGDEIWVAAGTYKPTTGTDRTISFMLKDGVAVYGGFAGTEISRDQRDYEQNVTTLSGDLSGNDNNNISINEATRSDNSFNVVSSSNVGSSTALDGFTISSANANWGAYGNRTTRGGGLWSGYGNPSFVNLIFTNNSAIDAGGGMFVTQGNPVLTNIIFKNNSAQGGGGLCIYQSNPTIISANFLNNRATYTGGGVVNGGGSEPTFVDVTFDGNTALQFGGGMSNYDSTPKISGATFYNNSVTDYAPNAGQGGGIYNSGSSPTIENTSFSGNRAEAGGSGLANLNSSPILTNVTFTNNWDAIRNTSSHPIVRNSIIWGNIFPDTGGIFTISDDSTSKTTISDSVVQKGQNGLTGGTNIITTDPALGSLGNYGGETQTIPLLAGSSAVDRGNDEYCPSVDQRGVIRPQGRHCDIGAYEYEPVTRYVKWNATGANNGTSWTNAYADLQSALAAASSGDEIWVAAGMYKPTTGWDRTISFTLTSGVAVYGGFVGTESLLSERDYVKNVTTLSGDIGMPDDNRDNSLHVVVGSNTDGTTILDGFTVTGGNANAGSSYTSATEGGGMLNQLGSPIVRNVIFRGNSAFYFGGGMYNNGDYYFPDSSHPTLVNVIFDSNSASEGGGMHNENYSKPNLTNVIFSNNFATRASGGMENRNYCNAVLTNVTFNNNIGGIGPGGMSNFISDATLTNVTFRGNSAEQVGGGMVNAGGHASLTNVTFSNNTAQYGGGIWNSTANLTLTNVTLSGNSATNSGGGIYSESNSKVVVKNTILWGNTAPTGVQVYDTSSVTSINDSVVQDGFANGTNIITTDPKLGSLGDYGGNTQTIPLLASSSAIDAGNDADCPATDQRLVTRPQGSHCDIGAYEYRTSPTVYYVKQDATGANNGTSWTNALRDLQSALAIASSGDEIWVAAGTYKPTTSTDRMISFALKNGVTILGGFDGTETLNTQRNPVTNPTVLSGDIGVQGDNHDNSYHVVISNRTDNTAVLDGFTITAGYADFEIVDGAGFYNTTGSPTLKNIVFTGNSAYRNGGGMYNYNSGSKLTNVTFSDNSAGYGGGLYNMYGSNLQLTDITFLRNSATSDGGGLYNYSISPTLTNVNFSNNSASRGGGLFNKYGNPTFTHVVFDSNSAQLGGGLYNWLSSTSKFTDVTFNNNSATSDGGGIYSYQSTPTLTNVTFNSNSAGGAGGGIWNALSSPTLTDVTFTGNLANSGGGMENYNSSNAILANVTFRDNSAQSGGGLVNSVNSNPLLTNVTFSGNVSKVNGGAIFNDYSNPTLTNVTFSGNVASRISSTNRGGGIYNVSSSPTIRNAIFWGNTSPSAGEQIYNYNSPYSVSNPVISDSVIQGGCPADSICSNILITNPLLGELANHGGITQTFPLQPGSSAIDAGDDANCPKTDQRGMARPQGSHCDIGAYEYQSNSLVYYVKQNATGANNGTSWTNAYTDLQSALAVASSGDEIWVAAGTYKPTTGTDRTISFTLRNGVAIYGGFAGTETLLTQRNPETNVTTLSGDIGISLVSSDNSYHVVTSSNLDQSTLLDGFTITGGNASGVDSNSSGGGIYNSNSNPNLVNLTISNNLANQGGGGIFNNNSNPKLLDVTIKYNSAAWGGGISNQLGSSPSLMNVTLNNNTAYYGGGIGNENGSSPTLINATFTNNSADNYGGAMINRTNSNPTLKNVTMTHNSATIGGGAIANDGGSLLIQNSILWAETEGEIANINSGTATVTYSIVQGGYSGTGNLDADPKLDSLKDNGGFTQTMALLPGSPAIDAGDDANCPETDQRGVVRPQEAHCDIGAYEFDSSIVTVSIGGSPMGNYGIPPGGRVTPTYNVLNGPVNIQSTKGLSIFASERVHNAKGFVNELMGLPNNQLTNEYWFPWYDNKSMQSWILVGNPSTATDAHVHIYIAGVDQNGGVAYTIKPGKSITPTYDVLNGPVHIVSDINVFTSERVHTTQGFVNEAPGIPNSQLTTEYWFPWYDNVTMQSWILVGNPSTTADAHVDIYIAGVRQGDGTYTIKPGERITPMYNVLNGPVHIVSDINIFTSMRVHNATGFINEAMGIPNNQLATEYWFPWYDNQTMQSWILVGNPSTTTDAHVHVYIAGVEQPDSPYTIQPGKNITPTFNILNGPVHIVSDISVFTSERVHTSQGFVNEAMGIPNDQLTTQYWFPWYDNVTMQSWILVGKP